MNIPRPTRLGRAIYMGLYYPPLTAKPKVRLSWWERVKRWIDSQAWSRLVMGRP